MRPELNRVSSELAQMHRPLDRIALRVRNAHTRELDFRASRRPRDR